MSLNGDRPVRLFNVLISEIREVCRAYPDLAEPLLSQLIDVMRQVRRNLDERKF